MSGGRPREAHVRERPGVCPEHGQVTLRLHKIGKYANGNTRYRARCPDCHAAANLAAYHAASTDSAVPPASDQGRLRTPD